MSISTFTYVIPFPLSASDWETLREGLEREARRCAVLAYEVWVHFDTFGTEVTVRADCSQGATALDDRLRDVIVNV